MQNPLTPSNMFDTPTDLEGLQAWIQLLNGSERAVAMTAAGMAWNLAAHLVDRAIAEDA